MVRISVIAAIGQNRELGKNNQLLFKIPEDFKRMKALTMGHPIIMGRKTFDSIGRILPGRTNIIISRDKNYKIEGAIVCLSLEEAIKKSIEYPVNEIFIFGGGQIFEQAMPVIDRLYLTVVQGKFEADTFFPEYKAFTKVIEKEERENGGYTYTFLTLERR
jgi:dihydrofolate reductase